MTQDTQNNPGGIVKRLVGRVRAGGTSASTSSTESSPIPEDHRSARRRANFKFGACSKKSQAAEHSSKSQRRDDAICLSLWNEAYDSLRLQPKTTNLVTTYESIIAQELPDDLKMSVKSAISSGDGTQGDPRRLELLEIIAENGLKKRRGSNNSSVNEEVKLFVHQFKEEIEEAWVRYRATPLAWAGICTMTPLLVETVTSKDSIKRGLSHVTGHISWYMHLSLLMLGDNWNSLQLFTERQDDTRKTMVDLYSKLLEFEMNCICASASSWNNAAKHVVAWQGLDDLVRELEQMDEVMGQMIEEVASEKVRAELERRNRNLELGSGREGKDSMMMEQREARESHGAVTAA